VTIGASAATTFARALAFRRGDPAMNSDEAFRRVMSLSGTWRRLRLTPMKGQGRGLKTKSYVSQTRVASGKRLETHAERSANGICVNTEGSICGLN
jgi:hypothetical protein